MAAMNWLEGYVALSNDVVALGVNLGLQTTLVIGGGLFAEWLCRRRGAAVQSSILRVTLVAALLCPGASWLLNAAGVPGFRVSVPPGQMVAVEVPKSDTASEDQRPAPSYDRPPDTLRVPFELLQDLPNAAAVDERFRSGQVSHPLTASQVTEVAVRDTGVAIHSEPDLSDFVAPAQNRPNRLAIVYALLTGAWLVAAVLLLSRLAVANLLIFRIRRAARVAPAQLASECRAIAASLNIAAPPVLVGARISPCLIGWLRPAILLPTGQSGISGDALAHELAHLVRRDCLWNLICRLSVALLPIQPLMWFLARRLERVADDVCDDYVLAHSRDRAAYARELVDIAERFQLDWSIATVGVGIATLKSSLGSRVLRILDTSRALSTHTGMMTLLAILVVGVLGAFAAGFIAAPRSPTTVEAGGNYELLTLGPDDSEATVSFSGLVLDPDGRPFAGAKVYLSYEADDRQPPPVRAMSGPGGRFEFAVSQAEYDKSYGHDPWGELPRQSTAQVVAVADGFGPAWIEAQRPEPNRDLTLRLVHDDVPIRGRVIDLEGRGIAGVTVRLLSITAWPDEVLESWIRALTDAGEYFKAAAESRPRVVSQNFAGLPESVLTDGDGRFHLTGIGRDRVVSVLFVGSTIVTAQNYELMTRVSESIGVPLEKRNPSYGNAVYYGATFEHAAAPTRPIVGVVRDKETGKPLAGATIQSDRFAGNPIHGVRLLQTKSDGDGRYRLDGMPKGSGNVVLATPAAGEPYLATSREVADESGLDPVEVNFELSRCILIRGSVTDKQTGKPVLADIEYFVPADNPNLSHVIPLESLRAHTADDGSFTVPGLPGRGLIGVRADTDVYVVGSGARDIQGSNESGDFPAEPHYCVSDIFHRVIEVNPAHDADSFTCNVSLDAGRTVPGVVMDPNGARLAGTRIAGVRGMHQWFGKPSESAEFTLTGVDPDQPRAVFFHHPEKQLGAAFLIDGTESVPLRVRLDRCGIVTGRVVDASGAPQASKRLDGGVSAGQFNMRSGRGGFFTADTDEQGRFTWTGLIPGVKYSLTVLDGNVVVGHIFDDAVLRAGEMRDLGDVRPGTLSQGREKLPDTLAAKPTVVGQDEGELSIAVRGQVLDPDGKPFAGAQITLWSHFGYTGYYKEWHPLTVRPLKPLWVASSGPEGTFEFRFNKSDVAENAMDIWEQPWRNVLVVAAAQGLGPGWTTVGSGQVTLQLVRDDIPITGRVLDLEGRPVAHASVYVERVMSGDEHHSLWQTSWSGLPEAITTDADGRFQVTGVGRNRTVLLHIDAPAIEHKLVSVTTDVAQNAHVEVVAGPTKPIVGTVRARDTGEPLAGVVVYGQEETYHRSVRAVTDEQGRYRIVGLPKTTQYEFTVYPPVPSGYLGTLQRMDDTTGFQPLNVDFNLRRGVPVRLRMIDKATRRPVRGVIHYTPLRDNPSYSEAELSPGLMPTREWHRIHAPDAYGTFHLVAYPGPGLLFSNLQGNMFRYLPAALNQEEKERSKFDWAIEYLKFSRGHRLIQPDEGDTRLDVEIELDPGLTVNGSLLGPDSKPVVGATAYGLNYNAHDTATFGSQADPAQVLDTAGFVARRMDGLTRRSIYFVHSAEKLAGRTLLRGDEQPPITVQLQRWGTVTGRIVDNEGNPQASVKVGTLTGRSDNDPKLGRLPTQFVADEQGRFKIDGLVPGVAYTLEALVGESKTYDLITNGLMSLEPGQTIDLGDVGLREIESRSDVDREQPDSNNASNAEVGRANTAATPDAPTREPKQGIVVTGRVVDPSGKPITGARLVTQDVKKSRPDAIYDAPTIERATTKSDGTFQFDLATDEYFEDGKLVLLAAAPSFGLNWVVIERTGRTENLTIQLVEDLPVQGRVVDSEGKPVRDLNVKVEAVRASSSGSLNGFLAGWQQEWADSGHHTDRGVGPPFTDVLSVSVTDEGRFEIKGVGKERLALIQLAGPTIAQSTLYVIGRRGIDTTPINEAADRLTRPEHRIPGQPPLLVGATFEYVALPTKVVQGTVREAETGTPVSGVRVSGTGGYSNSVESISDAEGRFKLVGLPKLKEYSLHAWPNGASSLMHRSLHVPDTAGLVPINVDIELAHGVVVTGRIIDKATGKGVPGSVRFAPTVDNKYFGTKPGYDSYRYERIATGTDRDGRFRLVTIPGTGVLVAQVIENDRRIDGRGVIIYKQADLSPEERGRLTLTEDGRYFIAAGEVLESMRVDHAAKVVDLELDAQEVLCDFLVDPGITKEVRVEGPDGRPLTGTTVAGMTAAWPITFRIEESRFTAYALDPQKPRLLLLYHAEQKLAGRLTIRGDETEVPTVRLTAAAALIGRALDPSGVPLAGAEVRINFDGDTAYELRRYMEQHRGINRTSSDGTFRIEGLMPECEFELYFRQGPSAFEAEGIWKKVSVVLATESSRAETIDLGEVKVKQLR